jgi:polar amino acid transport system substrate-binding protein
MRTLFAFAAVLVLSLSLSVRAGEVIVGTNAEFPPFELTDDGNNIIGYDIDIIKAVGKAAGFEVSMHDNAFEWLIAGLESGSLDAVVSAMTITEERRRQVDFSEPYYNASQVIVVAEGTAGLDSLASLKDRKVGAQLATTGAAMAEEALGKDNPDLHLLDKCNAVFTELILGQLDAVIVDLPVAETYVKLLPGLAIGSKPMSEEQYGIAVKKGDKALLDKINAGLAAIRKSGEYDAITKRWFSGDGK